MKERTFIIVGGQGSGKTTQSKKIIQANRQKLLIYDVNNEYGISNYKLPKFKDFLNKAAHPDTRNTLIVFEEATIFFDKGGDFRQMREILVRKRHTKNMVVLIFHTIRSIPHNVLPLVDGLIIFKTGDQPNYMENRFHPSDPLYKAWLEVMKNPDRHYKKLIKIRM